MCLLACTEAVFRLWDFVKLTPQQHPRVNKVLLRQNGKIRRGPRLLKLQRPKWPRTTVRQNYRLLRKLCMWFLWGISYGDFLTYSLLGCLRSSKKGSSWEVEKHTGNLSKPRFWRTDSVVHKSVYCESPGGTMLSLKSHHQISCAGP